MNTATRSGPSTSAPGDGSRTMTITDAAPIFEGGDGADENGAGPSQPIGVLRLRAKRSGNRVAWGEDVVDNEGAGKKKSKICCIYHRPKRYDESSSDDSSDSEDERSHRHNHNHSHSHDHDHDHSHDHSGGVAQRPTQQSQSEVHVLDLPDDAEPNAYEQGPSKGKGKRNNRA